MTSTIKFKSLSSGSCGNCYFLGVFNDAGKAQAGILIDAGVSPRSLKREFIHEGLSFDDFQAILITHDHHDHIRSLGSYCKHVHKPVWATGKLMRALSTSYLTGEDFIPLRRTFSDTWNEIVPGLISARWFEVPHDATQTIGFAIILDGYKYVHITDCGRMTDEAINWCRQADTVTLESNYDPYMLRHGPYPKDLQDRICMGRGHLSNGECAEALRQIDHEGLKNVFLCHLSEHNNTPQLALEACRPALDEGKRIIPLPRQTASPMFTLRDAGLF